MRATRSFAVLALWCSRFVDAWPLLDATPDNGHCSDSCLGKGVKSLQIGQNNTSGSHMFPWQIYKSFALTPPNPEITTSGGTLAPGYFFTTPAAFNPEEPGLKQDATVIYTDTGDLVWAGPPIATTNLNRQLYNGQYVLTYWQGATSTGVNIGHGFGNVTILDSAYNVITVICPDLGLNDASKCQADLHESLITPDNTILVSAYNLTQADLSSVGGPKKGYVYDSLFFEIDIATKKILYSWSALAHVPVSASKVPIEGLGTEDAAYDYFHINSVEKLGKTYLVNGRHVFSTYLVNNKAGDIIWHIQGHTGGDFGKLPEGGNFAWQHFARAHNQTKSSITISWFNNFDSAYDNRNRTSNALALELTLPPNKSTPPKLVRLIKEQPPILASSQGSYQILEAEGGADHQIMDFGQVPFIKEFGPEPFGDPILWSGTFGTPGYVQIYRGYKYPWSAIPAAPPDLVVLGKANASCRKGYVSWNGATDVTGYAVYEGDTKKSLCKVGQIQRKGFETQFGVGKKCVQVVPLKGSEELQKSKVVCS